MNNQEFITEFKKWRESNGLPRRDECREMYRKYCKELDTNPFVDDCGIWNYISGQPKPSMFLDSLFKKDSSIAKDDIKPTITAPVVSEDEIRLSILKCTYEYIKANNRVPELRELNAGYNVKKHYSTEKELFEAVKEIYDVSEYVLNESLFTSEYHDELVKEVKKYKRFVVTSAVVGKKCNKQFLGAIKNYCKRNDALCLVLPCQDVKNTKSGFKYELDNELRDFHIVHKDLYLNDNIFISNIKVSAKQILPLTGLHQFTTDASCVLASPKQDMFPIPNQHKKTPHVIMCTGAITQPNYDNDLYMSDRINKIAEYNHISGAIIVELENEKIFHFRQIQAGAFGELIDLGIQYNLDGTTEGAEYTYMVCGDSHFGEHNEVVWNKTKEMIQELNVKDVALHDVFGASSIAHWDKDKTITRAIKYEEGKLSLKEEAQGCASHLIDLLSIVDGSIDLIYSNHPLFLDRWVESGLYVKDPINLYYSLDIVKAMIEGYSPFEYMIRQKTDFNYVPKEDFDRVNFLGKLDDKEVFGVEISSHGSFGANGAKGSLTTYKKSFKKSISAHTHFPCITASAISVGTNSILDPKFVKGLSNWMHCNAVIYKNGSTQLINVIKDKNGEYTWRLE